MGPTNDRILQARLFSYPDTHRHRLGANFDQIPINCPYRAKIWNTSRDGPMTVNGNQGIYYISQVQVLIMSLTVRITVIAHFRLLKTQDISLTL
jgi:catalase